MHNIAEIKRKKLNHYARILIAISFVFLLYGFSLEIRYQRNYASSNIVSNVSFDTHTIVDINESLMVNGDVLEEGIQYIESSSNINSSISNRAEDYGNYTSKKDPNESLKFEIQNRYGITIQYGKDLKDYEVGGLSIVPLVDSNIINENLNYLNHAMSVFPDGFWKEIKNGGIPLTVYLIDSFSTYGVTGVTDSNYNRAIMSIAVQYGFEESFYHETYHYIERYMMKKGYHFTNWNSYNPANFSYGTINGNNSYNRTFTSDVYFVNDYAQTNESEDRASTFEYMMSSSKASCLNRGKPVWKKATLMSTAMDAVLNSVSPSVTEYWERYL